MTLFLSVLLLAIVCVNERVHLWEILKVLKLIVSGCCSGKRISHLWLVVLLSTHLGAH